MAGVIGGPGGYATVGPTRNYLGEAMSNVQDSMYRQNAQRIADERTRIADEQNLQEQRRRDFNDSMEFSSKYPFIATGTSIDGANRQAIDNAQKSYLEAQDNYRKTGDKKYLAVAENAKSSINNLNEMPKALALKMEDWKKNEAGYSPSSMSKKKAILDKMAKGDLMQENDENGRAVYTLVDRDENGNVSKILYSKLNSKQITDLLTVEPKFDISGEKGLIEQYQKNVGKATVTPKIVGNKEITTTTYPGAEKVATAKAQELIQNHSAVYSAIEQMPELKIDPDDESNYKNPEVLAKVADFYKGLLMETTPTTTSEKPYLDQMKFDYEKGQDKIANDFKAKEFNEKQLDKNTVTVGTTEYKFTDIGAKAKKEFYAKPENKGKNMTSEDWPAGSFKVIRTSTKVNSKTPSTKPVVKETPKQTQAQWNASWAKLKKGQKLVGLDGNTYTKN